MTYINIYCNPYRGIPASNISKLARRASTTPRAIRMPAVWFTNCTERIDPSELVFYSESFS